MIVVVRALHESASFRGLADVGEHAAALDTCPACACASSCHLMARHPMRCRADAWADFTVELGPASPADFWERAAALDTSPARAHASCRAHASYLMRC